jgi:hypothetical protein
MIGQKIERRENKWILYIVWTLDGKKSEMERERERERERVNYKTLQKTGICKRILHYELLCLINQAQQDEYLCLKLPEQLERKKVGTKLTGLNL